MKEKAVSDEHKDAGAGGESSLAADPSIMSAGKSTLTTGGTFDESAFMSPAGTPFIPASRTPAGVAAARNNAGGGFTDMGRSEYPGLHLSW